MSNNYIAITVCQPVNQQIFLPCTLSCQHCLCHWESSKENSDPYGAYFAVGSCRSEVPYLKFFIVKKEVDVLGHSGDQEEEVEITGRWDS